MIDWLLKLEVNRLPRRLKVRTIITGLCIIFDVQVEVTYIFVATTCLGVISLNDILLFGFPCDFLYHNHKVNAIRLSIYCMIMVEKWKPGFRISVKHPTLRPPSNF